MPPATPVDAAGQHEGDQLVVVGAVAERGRARLVLADALQHLAERRVDDAVDHQEPAEEHGGDDPVHRHVVGQVDEAEQIAARHLLDAVLAAGERCFQAEEVDHLRQRQRDHGEVDAGAADRQIAEHQAQRRAGQPAEGDREERVEVPELHGPGGDVAAHAEKRRVAERQQPDIADHQVERAGEQRGAQHAHQEHRIQHERRPTISATMTRKAMDCGRENPNIQAAFPNRPRGLVSRTITITRNTTVAEACG